MYVVLIHYPHSGMGAETHGIFSTEAAARAFADDWMRTRVMDGGKWLTDTWYEGQTMYDSIIVRINRHVMIDGWKPAISG